MAEKKSNNLIVLKHEFVPKHELMSEEAAKKVLAEYKVTKQNFPKILKTDPAIQHLNANRGDIIKITRKSMTAGRIIYYRVVI